jgi:hypothetical protein
MILLLLYAQIMRKQKTRITPDQYEEYLRFTVFSLEVAVKSLRCADGKWVLMMDMSGEQAQVLRLSTGFPYKKVLS